MSFTKVYTHQKYQTIRTTVASAEALHKALQEAVKAGKDALEDAEFLDKDELEVRSQCMCLVSPQIRIEASIIRQWGRKPNSKRDLCSVSVNAAKYPGGVAGFAKDSGIDLTSFGKVR